MAHHIQLFFIKTFSSWVFILRFENNKVVLKEGKVRSGFASDCLDIMKKAQLSSGLLYGVRHQNGIRIKASKNFSSEIIQRIRNVWSFYN
ncbi:MAG: DUF3634 family protein [Flavobacteriales bacterium]|jgi:hypothetical protein|nr:DUF3634 family protein [Flavobacteriales bacterium]